MDVVAPAEFDEAVLRPDIEERILHLHRQRRETDLDQLGHVRGVEIGAAEMLDLALALELGEPAGGVAAAGHRIVPPVKLDEVETLAAKALQRRLDDRPD